MSWSKIFETVNLFLINQSSAGEISNESTAMRTNESSYIHETYRPDNLLKVCLYISTKNKCYEKVHRHYLFTHAHCLFGRQLLRDSSED